MISRQKDIERKLNKRKKKLDKLIFKTQAQEILTNQHNNNQEDSMPPQNNPKKLLTYFLNNKMKRMIADDVINEYQKKGKTERALGKDVTTKNQYKMFDKTFTSFDQKNLQENNTNFGGYLDKLQDRYDVKDVQIVKQIEKSATIQKIDTECDILDKTAMLANKSLYKNLSMSVGKTPKEKTVMPIIDKKANNLEMPTLVTKTNKNDENLNLDKNNDLSVVSLINTKLNSQINKEKLVKVEEIKDQLREQLNNQALTENQKKYDKLKKKVKNTQTNILDFKNQLEYLPKPPNLHQIEFLKKEDLELPSDLSQGVLQYNKANLKSSIDEKQQTIVENIIEPQRDSQYHLQNFRNQLAILKRDKIKCGGNIRELRSEQKLNQSEKKRNKTMDIDQQLAYEDKKGQQDTAEELLDILDNKIAKKKEAIFSEIDQIKIHKQNLLKLLHRFAKIDKEETTKVFDWKPFDDYRKISVDINKTLQDKANGLMNHWNLKNDDFHKKQDELQNIVQNDEE